MENFEVLHGDVQGFPDTVNFLKSLEELDASHDCGDIEIRREQKAAAGLFNWEVVSTRTKIFF